MAHPTCYWAQNKEVVYLRIQVMGAENVNIAFSEEKLDFSCDQGKNKYAFALQLSKKINAAESKYRVLGQSIEVIMKKQEEDKEFWTQINNGGKLPYIRIDWDRWVDEDDDKPAQSIPDFSNMPGLGGMGGEDMPDLNDFKGADEENSDEKEDHCGGCKDGDCHNCDCAGDKEKDKE